MAVELIYADAWDTYGAGALASGAGTPPLLVLNSGASSFTVASIANPPWRPTGTGYYVVAAPGTTSIPNAGPGLYIPLGNPRSFLLHSFWFRYTGAALSGGTSFFWRANGPIGAGSQVYGTDYWTLLLDNSGHILFNSDAGTASSNALSANTWYLITVCVLHTSAAKVNVNDSNTGWVTGVTATKSVVSVNFDNEFSGTTFHFGPHYILGGVASIADALSSGGNLYLDTFFPTGDNAAAWTRSTGSNSYANVSSVPAGAAYNKSATVNQQDIYLLSPKSYTTVGGVSIITQMERDAIGDRVALPTWKNGAGTIVVGRIGTGGGLVNGTYAATQDGRIISPFTGVAFTNGEIAAMKAGVVVQD